VLISLKFPTDVLYVTLLRSSETPCHSASVAKPDTGLILIVVSVNHTGITGNVPIWIIQFGLVIKTRIAIVQTFVLKIICLTTKIWSVISLMTVMRATFSLELVIMTGDVNLKLNVMRNRGMKKTKIIVFICYQDVLRIPCSKIVKFVLVLI